MSDLAIERTFDADGPVGVQLLRMTQGFAICGGLLFLTLIGMSLVSIVCRKLGFGSVSGDIELMQAGSAVAAAAFLPYCTILGEHVKVDFFTENMRPALKGKIDAGADCLLALMAATLAWRTGLSAISIKEAGEVTTLVSLPLWIPVAAMVPSMILVAACAAYRAAISVAVTRHDDKAAP